MIRTTIYGIGLATLFFGSGAIATSITEPTFIPMSSDISSDTVKIAQSTINTAAIEQSVFTQINNYRSSKGLPKLTRNSAIDNQARIHSQNMASGKVAFGHTGFQERLKAIRISYRGAAENVAYNQGYSDPATQAVQGWLKSPGHLANIIGNYNLTGVGVASNSKGQIYFTQIFLRT
ncbi:CAP domain-containing protein [Nostoc sp. CCY 9925]|uniref:CAP domain-containing protein n=1 Tax=Nostoc sp. CCY 9925 TaxID=3103865 RepID=UPI0039C638E1